MPSDYWLQVLYLGWGTARSPFVFFWLHAELGYRGGGDVLKRNEFEARKKADRDKHSNKDVAPKPLASMGKVLMGKPFLQALAAREELVRNGKLTCILFIRDNNSKGQEISGYIDLGHRCV